MTLKTKRKKKKTAKEHQRRLLVWLNEKEVFCYEYFQEKDLFRLDDELEIFEESQE